MRVLLRLRGSAGCGKSTWIEKNGLKGYKSGGAMVSEKYAGFVINCGNAKAADVKNVIDKVRKTVLESDGVELEPEVILVGEF